MLEIIRDIIMDRERGIFSGIPSYCTANETVIRSIIRNAKEKGSTVLIEATSNQVNQNKGYSGMDPFEFVRYIDSICDDLGFPRDMVIKGGDHLGPLPWAAYSSDVAMDEAEKLVRMSVRAGYKKIHLDTTMKLGCDGGDPDDELIARRAARLYKACEEEYMELKKSNPNEEHPVFVIGSEVPYAGGIRGDEDDVEVTRPEDFRKTLATFHKVFREEGIRGAKQHIVAVVIQPGVDFGSDKLQLYDHDKFAGLFKELMRYPNLVFEGHSTDYQPRDKLKQMVRDGISILKVGPALTFAYREALYSLSYIEDMFDDIQDKSDLRKVIERTMVAHSDYWNRYYTGKESYLQMMRAFGLSDRCRYVLIEKTVKDSIDKLLDNMRSVKLPLGVLRQFLPEQYSKIVAGSLKNDVDDIIHDHIIGVIEAYEYAMDFRYISD